MFKTDAYNAAKESVYFTSLNACQTALASPLKTKSIGGSEIEIFPLSSGKDQRIIKTCYEGQVVLCKEGGDVMDDRVVFAK